MGITTRISARLSEHAGAGWDRTATREGVTLTALLEALGLDLADDHWKPPRRVIDEARRIDRDRRNR